MDMPGQRIYPLTSAPQTGGAAPSDNDRGYARWLPWITLLLCVVITALAWQLASNRTWRVRHEQFHTRVNEVQLQLIERMSVYSQVLQGVAGLLKASPDLTRSSFAEYARTLELGQQFPGIDGIGYAVVIPPQGLDYYEHMMRQEGFAGFKVYPSGPRDIYTSIHYIEPFTGGNRLAFGFDMYSDPTRRQAMARARDTGQIAMSAKADLIRTSEHEQHSGFLMYMPIYRPGMPHATLEQRRANIQGWAYAPFWVDILIGDILQSLPEGLMIQVYDGIGRNDSALLYSTEPTPASQQTRVLEGLDTQETLHLGQHDWTIYAGALPELFANTSDRTPGIVASAGLALSLTLSGMIWLLVHGRQRALRLARHMNRDLLAAQQDLQLAANVFSHAREGIMITDAQGTIVRVNATLCEITGYEPQELIGQNPRILASGRQDHAFYQDLWQTLADQGHWQGQTWNRRKNGELYAQLLTISTVRDDQGKITHYVGLSTDITPMKQQENRLEHMASTDPLTGLPNRMLLADRLEQAVLRARRAGRPLAVAFVDLDGFKAINDEHGHEAGDQLLVAVSTRMKDALRSCDTLARLGGDEFVVVIEQAITLDDLDSVMQRLLHAVSDPVVLSEPFTGLTLGVSASVGVAILKAGDTDDDADRLIRHADVAMYAAKQQGKNRYVIFDRHAFSDY
jgi:diguanylate cyclase (GGDEF)-like protein/PAS domain S-box-containing protein